MIISIGSSRKLFRVILVQFTFRSLIYCGFHTNWNYKSFALSLHTNHAIRDLQILIRFHCKCHKKKSTNLTELIRVVIPQTKMFPILIKAQDYHLLKERKRNAK